jgi:hypothetical protein
MWKDPIAEEVRAIRAALDKECHYDIGEIVAHLQKRSRDAGRELVSVPPKRVPKPAAPARMRRRRTA